jgi:hypothetical protein
MNTIEEAICAHCGRRYQVWSGPRGSRRTRSSNLMSVRRYNSVTCSRECAKEWQHSSRRKKK